MRCWARRQLARLRDLCRTKQTGAVSELSLGQNGWGAGYNGEYNVVAAFVFEVVATFLFLVTILGVTHPFTPAGFAGLAIGLTLVVIHLVGINITGTSVNPAPSPRNTKPATKGGVGVPTSRECSVAGSTDIP